MNDLVKEILTEMISINQQEAAWHSSDSAIGWIRFSEIKSLSQLPGHNSDIIKLHIDFIIHFMCQFQSSSKSASADVNRLEFAQPVRFNCANYSITRSGLTRFTASIH